MVANTKKNKAIAAKVDKTKAYTIEEAVKVLKDCAKERKFDETIELSFNLGIDPKYPDQQVRGVVSLPNGTGAKVRVAVITRDAAKVADAKAAGADIVGAEDLIETIKSGKIDFDRCIATPDMMGLVGQVAKVLGPKGMMPNPKLGTVTPDVKKAVTDAKAGSIEFRAEKTGIVQAGVGKASFDEKKLVQNVAFMIDTIAKAKPTGAKGTYMKKVSISSTMGPGLKLDISAANETIKAA
jgi:large subunit ribosomal protein L1